MVWRCSFNFGAQNSTSNQPVLLVPGNGVKNIGNSYIHRNIGKMYLYIFVAEARIKSKYLSYKCAELNEDL